MPDEDDLPVVPVTDAKTMENLTRDLRDLAGLIAKDTISPEILARIGALAALLPALRSLAPSSMCDNGNQGPAPQWEVRIGNTIYLTCAHSPPHIKVK